MAGRAVTGGGITYTAKDAETLRGIRRALHANRLAPLVPPSGLDTLSKGVFPILLGLLVALDLLAPEVLFKQAPLEGVPAAALRGVLLVLAAVVLAGLALTLRGRLYLLHDAEAAWRNANTEILDKGHAWFLDRSAEELRILKRAFDAADAAEPAPPMPTHHAQGHDIQDATLGAQVTRMARLITVSVQRGGLSDAEEAALHRLLARQALWVEVQQGQLAELERQRRGFRFSFLSLDLVLLPLAVLALLRNLLALLLR